MKWNSKFKIEGRVTDGRASKATASGLISQTGLRESPSNSFLFTPRTHTYIRCIPMHCRFFTYYQQEEYEFLIAADAQPRVLLSSVAGTVLSACHY